MRYVLEEYRKGSWCKVSSSDSLDFLVNSAVQLGYRTGAQGYPHPTVRVIEKGSTPKGANCGKT